MLLLKHRLLRRRPAGTQLQTVVSEEITILCLAVKNDTDIIAFQRDANEKTGCLASRHLVA